jgi:hypothetical protein
MLNRFRRRKGMDTRISKKKLLRIIGIVLFVIIIGYLFVFVWFPIMLIGPPTPLFSIHNFDSENHSLTISIRDSTKRTIFVESYTVQPNQSVHHTRGFGWYPTITWTPFTWSAGEYTFSAVLDDFYTASHTTNVTITQTIAIRIKFMDTPLEIGEIWV